MKNKNTALSEYYSYSYSDEKKEFIEKCKQFIATKSGGWSSYCSYFCTNDSRYKDDKNTIDIDNEEYLIMRLETGGVSGGSCWEGSDPTPYHNNEEFDYSPLDELLMHTCPDISLLKYRTVVKALTEYEYEDREYYGNRTDWIYKWISYASLYDIVSS